MGHECLTKTDVARLIRRSIITVERWTANGTLPPPLNLPGRRLWTPQSIQKFLEQRGGSVEASTPAAVAAR